MKMNELEIRTDNYSIYQGDCLEVMDELIKQNVKVDAIITDPPYGTTACKWDSIIPLDEMWERINKLIKPNGVICLFCTQPFTTNLINSNMSNFKYCWYWEKSKANGFQHSKNKPMRIIEEIAVFSKAPIGHKSLLGDKRMIYNPQGIIPSGKRKITESTHCGNTMGGENHKSSRPNQVGRVYESYTNFPNDILKFNSIFGRGALHPTQKPVALLEYLIKTYTNEDELVLDFTMGSGSTGVAALNTNRKFIGIELDENYFNIAKKRLEEAKQVSFF